MFVLGKDAWVLVGIRKSREVEACSANIREGELHHEVVVVDVVEWSVHQAINLNFVSRSIDDEGSVISGSGVGVFLAISPSVLGFGPSSGPIFENAIVGSTEKSEELEGEKQIVVYLSQLSAGTLLGRLQTRGSNFEI